jgi:hypothetical protein
MAKRRKSGQGEQPAAGVTETIGDVTMTTQNETPAGDESAVKTEEQIAAEAVEAQALIDKAEADAAIERQRLIDEQAVEEERVRKEAEEQLAAAKLEDERKAAETLAAAEVLKKSNPMFDLIEQRKTLLGGVIGRVERLGLEKNMAQMAVMAHDFREPKHIEMFVSYLKDNLHSVSPISVALNEMRMTSGKVVSVHIVFAALHTLATDRRYGRKSVINDAAVKTNVSSDVARRWILSQIT